MSILSFPCNLTYDISEMIAVISLLFIWSSSVISFQKHSICSRKTDASVLFAGGRSLEEKEKTQRVMFRDLKKKFNEAAAIPGFFEVGDGAPVYQFISMFFDLTIKRFNYCQYS